MNGTHGEKEIIQETTASTVIDLLGASKKSRSHQQFCQPHSTKAFSVQVFNRHQKIRFRTIERFTLRDFFWHPGVTASTVAQFELLKGPAPLITLWGFRLRGPPAPGTPHPEVRVGNEATHRMVSRPILAYLRRSVIEPSPPGYRSRYLPVPVPVVCSSATGVGGIPLLSVLGSLLMPCGVNYHFYSITTGVITTTDVIPG